ncbi:hypothetical protein [Streptomyces odontomachi]|uniref:hypothetical protein n=1 Tax=Streptomyces odontomachi TaxID=2944940 RepID=UPI00210867D4|nr:hypothetical protein [Streptomyces sp. ODS25]
MKTIKTLRRHRVATSLALTAGLVLAGVTSASASGADEHGTQAGKAQKGKRICVIVHKGDGKPGQRPATDKVAHRKDITHDAHAKCTDLPGIPGKGKHVCVIIIHKDGKGGKDDKVSTPTTATASAAGATQVSNGKPPKGDKCPLPHLPGKPGKGKHVCVIVHKDGAGDKGEKTTTEVRDGKVYVNGKQVSGAKGKLPKCPPVPGKPGGSGKGGSTGGK